MEVSTRARVCIMRFWRWAHKKDLEDRKQEGGGRNRAPGYWNYEFSGICSQARGYFGIGWKLRDPWIWEKSRSLQWLGGRIWHFHNTFLRMAIKTHSENIFTLITCKTPLKDNSPCFLSALLSEQTRKYYHSKNKVGGQKMGRRR